MSKSRAEAAAGAPGIILRYLQEQNRPYSAQDVFGNLQKEHGLGKASVVKALDQLAQEGKIKEKTYGKQKIFFADQDQFDAVSDADLHSLDAKIAALTAKVQSLQQSCRHMEAELKELTNALTTPEMQKEILELKNECARYTERLKNIKAATNHITPEEKEEVSGEAGGCLCRSGVNMRCTDGCGSSLQVYTDRRKYCKEWRKRKRMTTELCEAILEGYPKSKKQFFVSDACSYSPGIFAQRTPSFLSLPHRRKSG
ncbi:homologous-pairing protein 2 homolog isoform X1 [Microtus pennsylvanicus]|uniref:homologous-pairing protein 2 homolog isoform X1 n=1 Tax=Microtus pennsylvanicus TaxID=10058 RepID=UPI003F6B7808